MNIDTLFDLCGYRIKESSRFCWDCYGPNARNIDFAVHDGLDSNLVSAVFDTVTLQVYEVDVFVYDGPNKTYYRWIDPNWIGVYRAENDARGFSQTFDVVFETDSLATSPRWTFVDENTILYHARGIFQIDVECQHQSFEDTPEFDYQGWLSRRPDDSGNSTTLDLDVDKDTLFELMMAAHRSNMTLNDFINVVLRESVGIDEAVNPSNQNQNALFNSETSVSLVEPSWEQTFRLNAYMRRQGT